MIPFFICSLLKGTIRTKGTNSPFCMISTRFLPLGVPAWTSALSRSPVERCVKPYFSTIRSHCVPFPEPGPPANWKVQIPSRSLYISYTIVVSFHKTKHSSEEARVIFCYFSINLSDVHPCYFRSFPVYFCGSRCECYSPTTKTTLTLLRSVLAAERK